MHNRWNRKVGVKENILDSEIRKKSNTSTKTKKHSDEVLYNTEEESRELRRRSARSVEASLL